MSFNPIFINLQQSRILDSFDNTLNNAYADGIGVGVNVGGLIRHSGTTVTVTTATAHNFTNGETVYLSPGEANFPVGAKIINNVIDPTTFTYLENGSNSTSATQQVFASHFTIITKYSDDVTMSGDPSGDITKATNNRDLTRSAFRTAALSLLKSNEAWTELGPTLNNSWVYFGSGNTAAYYINILGEVSLKGWVKSGTLATNIFILPTGYRPLALSSFPAMSWDGINWIAGHIQVDTAGNVLPITPSNNNLVVLDSIRFRAA